MGFLNTRTVIAIKISPGRKKNDSNDSIGFSAGRIDNQTPIRAFLAACSIFGGRLSVPLLTYFSLSWVGSQGEKGR